MERGAGPALGVFFVKRSSDFGNGLKNWRAWDQWDEAKSSVTKPGGSNRKNLNSIGVSKEFSENSVRIDLYSRLP